VRYIRHFGNLLDDVLGVRGHNRPDVAHFRIRVVEDAVFDAGVGGTR